MNKGKIKGVDAKQGKDVSMSFVITVIMTGKASNG